MRWSAELAAFDFDIKYRPGKRYANADDLSHSEDKPKLTTLESTTMTYELGGCRQQTEVPNELRATVESLVSEAWLHEIKTRSRRVTLSASSTLPSLRTPETVHLQDEDEIIQRVKELLRPKKIIISFSGQFFQKLMRQGGFIFYFLLLQIRMRVFIFSCQGVLRHFLLQ